MTGLENERKALDIFLSWIFNFLIIQDFSVLNHPQWQTLLRMKLLLLFLSEQQIKLNLWYFRYKKNVCKELKIKNKQTTTGWLLGNQRKL